MTGTNRSRGFLIITLGAIALAVFWRTAYPSITWWDSSSYSTAAYTLGITGPPGSLLLTLIGWPVAHLPIGASPAHRLNLLAGFLAALTAMLVVVAALRLWPMTRTATDHGTPPIVLGAGLGALGFAFSADLWEHAIKFTPYILTAAFTALIILGMLRWWQDASSPGAWRRLLVLGLLFGIDVSVHRTNLLLVPAALLWVAIRRPRTFREPRSVLVAVGGLVAGLSAQLLLIPIARSTPSPMNFFEPRSLRALGDYVSLAGIGGNFLLSLWPRHSPLFMNQFADLLRAIRDSFLAVHGPAGVLGVLPALFVVLGAIALVRRSRKLGIAWLAVLLLQSALTVAYFNIPANFFRPFDRHYLPIFVTLGITMAFGTAAAAGWLARSLTKRLVPASLGVAAVAAVPVAQLANNWHGHDARDRHFTSDYARNALEALPRGAIYFTMGDNDTFPVFYAQSVDGVRRDVTIINLSLSNTDWYVAQLQAREPDFPLSLTAAARQSAAGAAPGDTIRIPVAGSTDTLALRTGTMYGPRYQPADIVLRDLLRTNAFRRPVAFALTVGSAVDWLQPHLRLEGLYWHLMPEADTDIAVLRGNLLERYAYRGFADPTIVLDDVTRMMGGVYASAFQLLATAARDRDGPAACRDVMDRYLESFPLDRIPVADATAESLRERCTKRAE
jgi:Protein O-mannosyl-transferase TMEM260-like